MIEQHTYAFDAIATNHYTDSHIDPIKAVTHLGAVTATVAVAPGNLQGCYIENNAITRGNRIASRTFVCLFLSFELGSQNDQAPFQ